MIKAVLVGLVIIIVLSAVGIALSEIIIKIPGELVSTSLTKINDLFKCFQEHFNTPLEFDDFHTLYHLYTGMPHDCDEDGKPIEPRSLTGQRQLRIMKLYNADSFFEVLKLFDVQFKAIKASNQELKDV